MFYHGKFRTPVTEVVLHCAAINTGQFDGMTPFQVFTIINRIHREERGFRHGFGYHGLIMPDGVFYRGRPFSMIGAHVVGHNTGTLGFLLIEKKKVQVPEGVNESDWLDQQTFADHYTKAQEKILRATLQDLSISHGIKKVSGHNDYAAKLCPAFRVRSSDWLPK